MSSDNQPLVLGIDPGLTRCGLGLVRGPATRPMLVDQACFTSEATTPVEQRLAQLHRRLHEFFRRHRPQMVAVERVLFSANVRTAMATGQAAGVALLVAAEHGLPVVSYSPNEVKQTVTGDGAADKQAVAAMVARQLRLDAAPTPADIADALAVAVTHLARWKWQAAVHTSTGQSDLAKEHRAAMNAGRGGWEAVLARREERAANWQRSDRTSRPA